MKKIILGAVMALSMFAATAQVMGSNGVKNTLWSGFGCPDSTDNNRGVDWYGLIDTLQARVDIGQFSMEGMINWGFFVPDNGAKRFVYTNKTPFYFVNQISQAESTIIDDAITDKYYVNFLWHPIKGLDLGAGTRLEWKVGPAPSCSDYYWGPNAHVKQGGLKYVSPGYLSVNGPGSTDVAGFVYYPNTYSSTIRGYSNPGALGIRYTFKDLFEIGMTIPSGTNIDDFSFNIGAKIQPLSLFNVSFAYEGICKNEGYLYAGVQLFPMKNLVINGYFAMDNLGGNENVKNGVNGFGLSGVYTLKGSALTIAPEFGMTFYENDDFTNAFYIGSEIDYTLNKQFSFGTWVSFAWGAENKYWHQNVAQTTRAAHGVTDLYSTTNNWNGGNVFAIRPKITMAISQNHSFTLYADYQARTSYKNTVSSDWAAGIFWTYTK